MRWHFYYSRIHDGLPKRNFDKQVLWLRTGYTGKMSLRQFSFLVGLVEICFVISCLLYCTVSSAQYHAFTCALLLVKLLIDKIPFRWSLSVAFHRSWSLGKRSNFFLNLRTTKTKYCSVQLENSSASTNGTI